ncbi:MAG: hypothetical protein AAFQ07_11875 [Chloroflexota bacterium]
MKKVFGLLLVLLLTLGSAAITFAQLDGGELDFGEEVEVDVDGEDEVEFTFEGEEDMVVTIRATSEADQDITVELLDPDGDQVAIYESFGNPALTRILLEDDGEYTIIIEERDGEELDDEIEIILEETELLDLNEGTQTLLLDDDIEFDYMVFEAEEDVQYVMFITLDGVPDSTLYVDLVEEDEFFAAKRLTFAGMEEAGVIFEAEDDGDMRIEFEFFAFGGDEVEVTVTIEEQE